jgi:hypothetical protein
LISHLGWFSSVLCDTDSNIIGGYQVVGGRGQLSPSESGYVEDEVDTLSACQLPGGRRRTYFIGWFSSVLCDTDSVIIGGYQVVGGRGQLSSSESGYVEDEVDSLSACQLPGGRRRTYFIAHRSQFPDVRFA